MGHAVGSGPLLETKLYIPKWRPSFISRPRLIERLDHGAERKLTLVSAPAGFGKTTLLAEWLAATATSERPAAWVTLDQSDNDPTLFWAYFIAALQKVQSGVGEHTRALLNLPQSPPIESVLTTLINEIAAIESDFALILDDFHVIDAEPVHSAVAFLLDYLPPQMHVVIASRSDPPLPLARLRGRGELTELRAPDLRLTPDEAAAFLTKVMGLDLSAADVAALETRTEGWIAGLQMAALSMQGRDDMYGFIRAFAGDDRYIVDYLIEEVLQRQPEGVRSFLLQTAILDRLSGPLCDAVTGQGSGTRMLAALERGNLFVVPLDDKRQWYRYHHLFANVLTVQLMMEQPEQLPTLYRRASEWYERHGEASEAIRYALAAADFERAADLIEMAVPAMRRSRLGVTVLAWLKALPEELIHRRPVLSVAYAWALLAGGELEDVEARLRDSERWLDTVEDPRTRPGAPAAKMVVVDEEEFRRLPATIAVFRAGLAQVLGDVPATMTYARRALDLSPEDDHLRRGAAEALLGLAFWASGELEAAQRHYAAGMARVRRAGHLSDVSSSAVVLADISTAQGRLCEAERTLEQAVQRAMEQGEPVLPGTADLFVGLSELQRERNDLDVAEQHLATSREFGERTGLPPNRSRWCVAMARLREAHGDLDGALDLFHEAERVYVRDYFPNVRPVAALRARVWVVHGRLGEALDWALEQGLSAEDDLSYLREFEHITLARILLARYTSERTDRAKLEAMRLLERLLKASEEGERTGSAIEILVLQALAHQMRGDISAASIPLHQALALAEPEGYVRIFVDEGAPMMALLKKAAKQGISPSYVHQLLTAAGTIEDAPSVNQDLIEPLSDRELDVLRLLGTDLGGPDIAHELMVSVNTLRTHTRHIYAKLGANSRRAAVHRAEELGILPRNRNH